jgi:hypothetical protein
VPVECIHITAGRGLGGGFAPGLKACGRKFGLDLTHDTVSGRVSPESTSFIIIDAKYFLT